MILWGIFSIISLSQTVFAEQSNCAVTVVTHRKSGTVSQRVYRYEAQNPKHCDELAEMHRENYAPHTVASVEVKVSFKRATK